MKNIIRLFIPIFSCLLFFTSCVKESDVVTKDDPVISDPIEGEIYRVSGTVLDTTNIAISNAQVKAYFDDLEIETIADQNGNFIFDLPITHKEGYFVANKENYTKAITRYTDAPQRENRLYLTEDAETDMPNLKLSTDSLVTVIGRAVEADGTPIENANILSTGIYDITFDFEFIAFTQTAADGTFEIIVEKGDYALAIVYAKYPSLCGTQTGKNWSQDQDVMDLGDFSISTGIGNSTMLNTNIFGEGCSANDLIEIKSYLTENLDQSVYEQNDPAVEITYCSDTDSKMVYVGAQSPDKQHFDGKFVNINEVEDNYDFSICTPSGFFGEITTKAGNAIATGHFNPIGRSLFLKTDSEQYFFTLFSNVGLNVGGETKIQGGYVPGIVSFNSSTGVSRAFDSNTDFGIYADILEETDELISGIIHGSGFDDSGIEEDFHIRFRVEKIQ